MYICVETEETVQRKFLLQSQNKVIYLHKYTYICICNKSK